VPDKILDWQFDDPNQTTIDKIESTNARLLQEKKDVFDEDNIGSRSDWWTDAVFAGQQFVGTNPTTIKLASPDWAQAFAEAAQPYQEMHEFLTDPGTDSLYVQDCSYFRSAVGAAADADLVSNNGVRYHPATVTLFRLTESGVLHPLAIVIDFKIDLKHSVVKFNSRVDPASLEAKDDWPWRYAKTCAQVADWYQHELTVHLTNTHLVEEVTIVAAHRSFSTTHPVYELLQPHWLKTLSVNAAARASLVPSVIAQLIGTTNPQLYAFIRDAYQRFDWKAKYVPNDLSARGFALDKLESDPRYHNYGYGRNIVLVWEALRKFVAATLAIDIHSDNREFSTLVPNLALVASFSPVNG
jgi:hypothetical protein